MDDRIAGPVLDGMADPQAKTTRLFSPRVKLAAFVLLIAAALAYFAIAAFNNATVYYMTAGELEREGPTEEGRVVRVAGALVQDSFVRAESGLDASFSLRDPEGAVLPVAYTGEVGQLFFNENSQIVLEGTYGSDGVFDADNLIISCPSKYENVEEGAVAAEGTEA